MRALTALLAGAAGLLVLATAQAATPLLPRVTVITDSVGGDLTWDPPARAVLGKGLDLNVDARTCRRLVAPGCPYDGVQPPSALDAIEGADPAWLGSVVTVDVGYNDPPGEYAAGMDEVMRALVARGVTHVIWVTLREEQAQWIASNEAIRAEARVWPQVTVADWDTASRGKAWFSGDGVHLNPEGVLGLAELLRPYVMSACGGPCDASQPYPAQHEGSGHEPTRIAGVFAGSRFVARSALVRYEIGLSCCPSKTIGDVVVYLFEARGVSCRTLDDAKDRRFFTFTVQADGRKLPVRRPVPASFFQQASFNIPGLTSGFQIGTRIVFTKIGTSKGDSWHGSIRVPRSTLSGKTYSLAGTFAAPWCGTTRP
jgi:hypothetical protein